MAAALVGQLAATMPTAWADVQCFRDGKFEEPPWTCGSGLDRRDTARALSDQNQVAVCGGRAGYLPLTYAVRPQVLASDGAAEHAR